MYGGFVSQSGTLIPSITDSRLRPVADIKLYLGEEPQMTADSTGQILTCWTSTNGQQLSLLFKVTCQLAARIPVPLYTLAMIQSGHTPRRKQYVIGIVLALFLADLPSITFAQTPAGNAFEEAEALFRQNPEWLGTDGANSTPLGNDRIFWSFEDTFIATSEAHTRKQSTLIRNSVAIQTGNDPLTAKMSFYWGQDTDGLPTSFFPEDGEIWYWTGGAIRLDEGPLISFLHRTRPTPGAGLGFANTGYALAIIKNPDQPPSNWEPVIINAKQSSFDAVPATALVREGNYIVGLALKQEGTHAGALVRYLSSSLAVGDIDSPQWWAGPTHGWVEEQDLGPTGPVFVIDNAGAESSLHWDQRTLSFVHIATYGFGAATIGMRTAPALTGPWSNQVEIYRPPELGGSRPFIYSAIAHPELQSPDSADLIVTYATNSFEFGDMFTEYGSKNLYWPRFITVKVGSQH
jgi:hypothetical protein